MNTTGLGTKSLEILRFIETFVSQNNYSPSFRDIQQGCHISSTSVVNYHLRNLEKHGCIRRSKEVARAIELVQELVAENIVPIVGTIAAGEPIPVVQDMDLKNMDPSDYIEVPSMIGINPSKAFAVRVRGSSMIDALIQEGDIVVLEQRSTVRNGDMVAAWLLRQQEATLKHWFLEGEKVRLQPANEQMEPIIEAANNVEVQGVVVGVVRSFR
jgi:repressor LexA